MRCFPHCCPEHAQRCYCGTSVHALVTFDTELPVAAQRNIVVCARFEPSRVVPLWPANLVDAAGDDSQDSERKLQPGEVVSLPESVLCRSSQEEEKLWVRADREGDVKHQTLPKNAVLYVLNNHRFPKWFYNYDSSITRTQREMTHHLALYVFQLTGSRSRSGQVDVLVLARHQSPAFKLISYRRSGNNATDAGCDLPAIDVAEEAFSSIDTDSAPPPTVATNVDTCRSTSVSDVEDSRPGNESETKSWYAPASKTTNSNESSDDNQIVDAISDSALWRYNTRGRGSGLAEKAQHLLILWRFLGYVSFADVGIAADKLNTEIRSHWMRLARAVQASPDRVHAHLEMVLSSFFLSITPSTSRGMEGRAPQELLVEQAATQLLLRALASQAVQYVLQSAFSLDDHPMGGNGVDEVQLRERFVTLVLGLYDVLEGLLQSGSPSADSVFSSGRLTLPALVDEVLSLIYRQKQFSSLRADVPALLMGVHSQPNAVELLYHAFTAQVVTMSRSEHSSQDALPRSPEWTGSSSRGAWSRRWLLEPGSIHVSTISDDRSVFAELSVVDLVRWLHEFACIDVIVRPDQLQLSLRSVLLPSRSATTLSLDGHLHGFSATLTGISSLVATRGDWQIGDYIASFTSGGLETNYFAYQDVESSARADDRRSNMATNVRRLQLMLRLDQSAADPRDRFIYFRGVVCNATYTAPCDRLLKMTAVDRSAALKELEWVLHTEINGGYVAAPAPVA